MHSSTIKEIKIIISNGDEPDTIIHFNRARWYVESEGPMYPRYIRLIANISDFIQDEQKRNKNV